MIVGTFGFGEIGTVINSPVIITDEQFEYSFNSFLIEQSLKISLEEPVYLPLRERILQEVNNFFVAKNFKDNGTKVGWISSVILRDKDAIPELIEVLKPFKHLLPRSPIRNKIFERYSTGEVSQLEKELDPDHWIRTQNIFNEFLLEQSLKISLEDEKYFPLRERILQEVNNFFETKDFENNEQKASWILSIKPGNEDAISELIELLKPFKHLLPSSSIREEILKKYPVSEPSKREQELDPEHWKEITGKWVCLKPECKGVCGHVFKGEGKTEQTKAKQKLKRPLRPKSSPVPHAEDCGCGSHSEPITSGTSASSASGRNGRSVKSSSKNEKSQRNKEVSKTSVSASNHSNVSAQAEGSIQPKYTQTQKGGFVFVGTTIAGALFLMIYKLFNENKPSIKSEDLSKFLNLQTSSQSRLLPSNNQAANNLTNLFQMKIGLSTQATAA